MLILINVDRMKVFQGHFAVVCLANNARHRCMLRRRKSSGRQFRRTHGRYVVLAHKTPLLSRITGQAGCAALTQQCWI